MLNKKPMLLVLAGPNGSGKSTITTFFDKVGKYTNADDIVAATGMDNMEAAILVDKMRYDSIDKKEDFTFETVLSSEYKLNILRKAKEEGYFIKCVFVLTVDPQINITRIQSRVASGGHNVVSWVDPRRFYEEDPFWCEECLEKYEEGEMDEESEEYGVNPEYLLPICNSPRMGVCGYEGSSCYPEELEPDKKI